MNETATQPLITLTYALGGIVAYFFYKLVSEVRIIKYFNRYSVLLDILIGLFVGLLFLGISHFLFNGVLAYYMPIGYVMGIIIAYMLFQKPIELIINQIKKGVKIFMKKFKEFTKKLWNKITTFAQSIFKGGEKNEQKNNK